MNFYDVFNGDADGICALHQLRLQTPRNAELITGVKREVHLLRRIEELQEADITVLDISLDVNRSSLLKLLNQNNQLHYWDHHFSGAIPDSPLLHSYIDTSSRVCTSILVHQFLTTLATVQPFWAIVGAFGDNLAKSAISLANSIHLGTTATLMLQELGILMNYNAYGKQVQDLHIPPVDLYRSISPFNDPRVFCKESTIIEKLRDGYNDDMRQACEHTPSYIYSSGKIFELPDVSWSRRVSGVFGNEMANREPSLAHAVCINNGDGTIIIGVRAPLERPGKAGELCQEFGGGGRAAAGGINNLPEARKEAFFEAFQSYFS